MKDSEYIYAVACIRTKEKNLLSDADIQTIAAMKDEKSIINYLVDRGWGSRDTRTTEELLSLEEEKINALLYDLGVDHGIIDVLSYPQQYHNLKTAIKQVCQGTSDPKAYYKSEKFNGEKMAAAIRSGNYAELPEEMRELAEKTKAFLLETRDGQRCDFIIDSACLSAMLAAAHKSKDAFLINYAETKVATADIKIAVRACDTKRKRTYIEEALADCEAFKAKPLAEAASKGRDSVYAYLEKGGYLDAVAAMKESFSAFERWCDNHMMDTIIPQKHNIESSGPVVAFYLARQNEIQMIRIITTAKANGFPDSAIQERVRKMYG